MIETVSDTVIKDVLRAKEKKIANIHEKMIYLYKELQSADDVLDTAALPAIRTDGMPGGKGRHQDLGDVLLNYRKQLYERNLEARNIMWRLTEEEAMISRIWACFCALDDPFYGILQQLYVENKLYQAVEMESGMSHKTFEKHRRTGIDLIRKFYESGQSIADLMCRKNLLERPKKQKTKESIEGYSQLELTAYFEEKEEKLC